MTPKLADRLTKFIVLLSSPQDGEALAAARMILPALRTEGLDLHDLAKRLCSEQPAPASGFDASGGFTDWAADFARREAEREREREAYNKRREAERESNERATEAHAAEKAAKAAARAAERATPEYKARVAQRRRAAQARKAAEAAAEAERAEAERHKADRIAAEGPLWNDLGDAARRAWVSKILSDPSAKLDPSATAALDEIAAALAPPPTRAMRGRRPKPKVTTWKIITPEWIASFEMAARDHAMRQRHGSQEVRT
jgi:hypothetical protein